MLARVFSCTVLGIEGIPLEVEVDISDGLPSFDIIGLPDASVREARERVRAALRNSGFKFPYRRITVNLDPADLKKEGPSFDLAMAIGLGRHWQTAANARWRSYENSPEDLRRFRAFYPSPHPWRHPISTILRPSSQSMPPKRRLSNRLRSGSQYPQNWLATFAARTSRWQTGAVKRAAEDAPAGLT